MSPDDLFPDHVEGKVRALLLSRIERDATRLIDDFISFSGHCQSPIEKHLLAAFIEHSGPFKPTITTDPFPQQPPGDGDWLFIQPKITCYRLDFALWHKSKGPGLLVGIECDGHDFHERTPRQAARDRSRDRALTALGVKVLRFTGSEIWANPEGCADEALDLVERHYFAHQ